MASWSSRPPFPSCHSGRRDRKLQRDTWRGEAWGLLRILVGDSFSLSACQYPPKKYPFRVIESARQIPLPYRPKLPPSGPSRRRLFGHSLCGQIRFHAPCLRLSSDLAPVIGLFLKMGYHEPPFCAFYSPMASQFRCSVGISRDTRLSPDVVPQPQSIPAAWSEAQIASHGSGPPACCLTTSLGPRDPNLGFPRSYLLCSSTACFFGFPCLEVRRLASVPTWRSMAPPSGPGKDLCS